MGSVVLLWREPEPGLGKLSRAGQGYKAVFFLFQFAMEPNYLHIWPRNTFMMIALPNMVLTLAVLCWGTARGWWEEQLGCQGLGGSGVTG